MELIGLYQMGDPYEPPNLLGVFETKELLLNSLEKLRNIYEGAEVFERISETPSEYTYVNIETGEQTKHVRYERFPVFYIDKIVVNELTI